VTTTRSKVAAPLVHEVLSSGATVLVKEERTAPLFALRAAPIQVNYLGYPGTMGADYIDYIIADPHVIPAGQEKFYAEKVVRLPDAYQVNDRKRAVAPLTPSLTPSRAEAGLPPAGFVFCCFNNNFKITPAVFDIWMRLLARDAVGLRAGLHAAWAAIRGQLTGSLPMPRRK